MVTAGVVSPDGRLLVTASTDGVARVWRLAPGRLVADLVGHLNRVSGAAFSADGHSLVTWSPDGAALVWEPDRGSARVALAGHGDAVTGAAFDSSGDRVLTTGADGRARVWDSADDLDVVAAVAAPVAPATFSVDGRVAAVAQPSRARILRSRDGESIVRLPTGRVGALALSRERIAARHGGRQPRLRLAGVDRGPFGDADGSRDADGGRLQSRLASARGGHERRDDPNRDAGGESLGADRRIGPRVTSVALTHPAAGSPQGSPMEPSRRGTSTTDATLYRTRGHRRGTPVNSVAYSTDGRRLVTAGKDFAVRVWDAATGSAAYTLRGHYGSVLDAAFSPDGAWIVSAGPTAAGLWDLSTGERFLFLRGHRGPLCSPRPSTRRGGRSRRSASTERCAPIAATSAPGSRGCCDSPSAAWQRRDGG